MIMKKALLIFVVSVLAVASCGSAGGREREGDTTNVEQQNNDNSMNAKAENRTKVLMNTSLGEIVIELYDETPKHRDNFLKLVRDGYYNGVLFHRVIKDFMIQTGDPKSKNAAPGDMLGAGDPGYTIEAEIVYPEYFHKRGALAAARTGDNVNPERRSSGSQFYIVTGRKYAPEMMAQMEHRMNDQKRQQVFESLVAPRRKEVMKMRMAGDTAGLDKLQAELIELTEQEVAKNPVKFTDAQINAYTTVGGAPHLDGQYTVFGEVTGGMDVVDKIECVETGRADRPVTDVKVISMKIVE